MAQQNNPQPNEQGNDQLNQPGDDQFNFLDVEMGEGIDDFDEFDEFFQQNMTGGPPPDQELYNTVMYNDPRGLLAPNQYPSLDQYDANMFPYADPGAPQDPDPAPPPVPPPAPIPTPAQPLPPIIGFSKRGRAVNKALTGPFAEDVPAQYTRPRRHQLLQVDDPEQMERQLLYYVDASKRRESETFADYTRRMLRCNENMGLEVRVRPELPPRAGFNIKSKEYAKESKSRTILHKEKHEEHRLKLLLDPDYARKWLVDKANRQARNAQRRRRAKARLRNEYENIGVPDFPSPPSPDDSGDDLYTFDDQGPLDRPPGHPVNIGNRRTAARKTTRGNTQSPAAEQSVSDRRCARCARLKQKCSIGYNSALPCRQCKEAKEDGETVEECVPQVTGRRGVKPGTRRGPYNARSPARERSRSASPRRELQPCTNCLLTNRTCDGNRPCSECEMWGESCDGAIQGGNYQAASQGNFNNYYFQSNQATGFQPNFNSQASAFGNTQGFGTMQPEQQSPWGLLAPPPQRDLRNLQPFSDVRATYQGNNMQYPTPTATMEAARENWLGGSQPAAPGSNQQNYENPFEQRSSATGFSPYTIQNNGNGGSASINPQHLYLDPALFTANQQLPPTVGPGQVAAPLANQDTNTPTTPTYSPVLPLIKIIRLAVPGFDTSGMNANLGCNEMIDAPNEFGFDVCGERPTMPCADLQHGGYNICDSCHYIADTNIFQEANRIEQLTKTHMCRVCADTARDALSRGGVSVKERCCLCVGQMQQAWLCDQHKRDAVAEVRRKAVANLEYIQRKVWGGGQKLCLVCNERPTEARSRGWVCNACGEHVVLR